ncbi:MAG: F0F1 ATP synthase subunit B [Leptolyngbya sp. SIO4C1]|nr:F0F1 ATP synthase subunit B [Leptolyngbya sp. SIO4C1]
MEFTKPLWLLASEEGGFGLNFDILETNLINLVIIIGVLIYFGSKFLGQTLAERRATIEASIREAEDRQQKAAAALSEQQKNLERAQQEAERIKAEARENAERAKAAILAQSEKDVERLKASAQQDLESQQERVLRELRQRVAAMAMDRVEARLPEALNDDIQKRLVDRSIALLGGNS